MRVFKRRTQRWLAMLVCALFTVSLFPEAAQANLPSFQMAVQSETPRILNIDIPTELASVEEWYQAPNKKNPKLIVHIQDAHANYEAQTNIRDVIDYLNTRHGFKTILVEGASSELDPSLLKLFPDEERNLKLVDELAKIGEVNGAEMFLVEKSDAAKGIGIERPDLYRRNFDALQAVYAADEFTNGFFEAYEQKLGQIASRSFGPRMIQALAEWRKFESGHRDFLPFVSQLAELSKKVLEIDLGVLYAQIDWPQLTRLLVLQNIEKRLGQKTESGERTMREQALIEKQAIIDLLQADPEMSGLIAALNRLDEKHANLNRIGIAEGVQASAPRALLEALVEKGQALGLDIRDYPAFAQYAGYLILRSEIVPGALFEEIKKLFDLILETLVKDPPSIAKDDDEDLAARKRLLLLHRDEMLARKLLKLELSHDEWLAIVKRQERFYPDDLHRRMLQQLGQNIRMEVVSEKEAEQMKQLQKVFRSAFSFYSTAVDRETVFFQRMQQTLETTDKAIMITGGFHSEGMKYYFRKYDISYGTLTPRITQNFSNESYRRVMMAGFKEPGVFHGPVKTVEQSNLIAASLSDRTGGMAPEAQRLARERIVHGVAKDLGWKESIDPEAQENVRPAAFEPAALMEEALKLGSIDEASLLNVLHSNRVLIGAGLFLAGVAVSFFSLLTASVFAVVAIAITFGGVNYVTYQGMQALNRWNDRTRSGPPLEMTLAQTTPTGEVEESQDVEESQIAETASEAVARLQAEIEQLNESNKKTVPANLISGLIESAQSLELEEQDAAVKFLNTKVNAQAIQENQPGDKTKVLAEMANFRIAVATLKVQAIRKEAESAERDARIKAVIQEVFDSGLIENLRSISFSDLEVYEGDTAKFSPAEVVAFMIAFGFMAENTPNKSEGFSKLVAAMASKIAPAQASQTMEMLRTFFPDMFSMEKGRLVQVMHANDLSSDKVEMLQMFAALNPNLIINIIVYGASREKILVQTSDRIRVAYVSDKGDVSRELGKRNGVLDGVSWSEKVLLAVPFSPAELGGVDSRFELVQEDYKIDKNEYFLAASHAKIRAAQSILSGQTLLLQPDSGITRINNNYVINEFSLKGLVESVALRYLAALQISRSA